MVALVDHERLAQPAPVELVGADQEDDLDLAGLAAACQDPGDVPPALARDQAEVEAADPGGRGVQHVEAVPAVLDAAAALGELGAQARAPRRRRPRQSAPMPRISIGCLACLERVGEVVLAIARGRQRLRAGAQLLDRIGQRVRGTDPADREAALRASACAGAR